VNNKAQIESQIEKLYNFKTNNYNYNKEDEDEEIFREPPQPMKIQNTKDLKALARSSSITNISGKPRKHMSDYNASKLVNELFKGKMD
jgi:hypothetical protein